MPELPPMTPGDRQFLVNADQFGVWRGTIIDCSTDPISDRDHWRFRQLATSLLDYIRKHRPDLDIRALYRLSFLDPQRRPPQGELAMLIDDASDVICETVHGLETGRIGEYIEAACPSLRKEAPPVAPATPVISSVPKKRGRPKGDTSQELAILEDLRNQPGDWYKIAANHAVPRAEIERVYDKYRKRGELA